MRIYPAIDIMGGKAVRLYKGDRNSAKIYGDPLEFALKFSSYFKRLHIIDLDGSFSGSPKNLEVLSRIKRETGLWIQTGGGFRTIEAVESGLNAGADSVIVGTAAMDPHFMNEVAERKLPVTVSLDASSFNIVTNGWQNSSETTVPELFSRVRGQVSRFIFTDTDRDGTLSGPSGVRRFWSDEEMVYAGGISGIGDIRSLGNAGFSGTVVGKAIYEGKVDLRELSEVER